MIETPAAARRRGQAAPGTHSPRRPRAARSRTRLIIAAIVAVTAGSMTLAGCAGTAPAPTGNVFTTNHQVSLRQVQG